MNVMLLTWEYPPKRVGNISDHVSTLAHGLVMRGNDVEVVVLDDWKTGFEDVCGVHVHRFANPVRTHPMASVLSYTMTASVRMVSEAANVIYFYRSVGKDIDVVHAHEWLTVPSAILLKHAFNIPFVLTFHSIEKHRCHNNFSPLSIAVKEIEDLGIWESAYVITNSEWFRNEVLTSYGGGHAHKMVAICPLQRNWVDSVVEIYGKVCNLKSSG